MTSLKSIQHLAVANNYLSTVVGAFKILRHCDNLVILILCLMTTTTSEASRSCRFLPSENANSEAISLCGLQNIGTSKELDLSKTQITGTVMPSLFVLSFTQNLLSVHLPPQLASMPALYSGSGNSTLDLSYLQLPSLINGRQYNRLYNLCRRLAVDSNSLSGQIL